MLCCEGHLSASLWSFFFSLSWEHAKEVMWKTAFFKVVL